MLKFPASELNAMLGLKRPVGAVPKNTAVLARLSGVVPSRFVVVAQMLLVAKAGVDAPNEARTKASDAAALREM
jgi:hypothetical protein